MDLWQYHEIRKMKSRLNDLISVVFAFVIYEVWGIWPVFVFLVLDLVMRIYQGSKNKKKEIQTTYKELIEYWG